MFRIHKRYTRLRRLAGLFVAVSLTCLAGCDTVDDEDEPNLPTGPSEPGAGPPSLDPDVLPITQGNWYRAPSDVTWQWQLQGTINTSHAVALYDVDLFETPDAVIAALHARGAKVMCYFSAGSGENWRTDYAAIPVAALGKPLDGYPTERWLDIRSPAVFAAMTARLDLAVRRGCDAVEPDNVTAYNNDTGFPLTARDQLAFNRNLANAAHTRGLGIALKNDGDQAAALVEYFDLELNEECLQYDECDQLRSFLTGGKPVLNAEYAASAAAAGALAQTVCPAARARGLRTLILPLDLDDSFRHSCF
jgi:hypothetical protein